MFNKQIFIHQGNRLSFSYDRKKVSRKSYDEYKKTLVKHDYSYLHENDSEYLYLLRNGIYNINKVRANTFCKLSDIRRSYYLSDNLYFYNMKYLSLNIIEKITFNPNITPLSLNYVSTSYYPEDILEINLDPYYLVKVQGKQYPIYLSPESRVYNECGEKIQIKNIINRICVKKLMGLNNDHQIKEYLINDIKEIIPTDSDNFCDTPFYSIGYKYSDKLSKFNIIIDHIIVELD